MSNKPKIIIKKISSDSCPKTSSEFGYFYEDILKKKSLRYIEGLKSIYDPGIFSKNGRNIKAIKAFIIQGKDKKEIVTKFKSAVENNEFYVFPYFLHTFDFSMDNDNYQIEIKEKDIDVYKYDSIDKGMKKVKIFYLGGQNDFFTYEKESYDFNDFKANKKDCWQIYLLKERIFMIVFIVNLEVDGFFMTEKDFKLEDYKAEEFYNYSKADNNIIKKGTNIIYEVKSGKNLASLSEQIIRDYYFFEKFFQVYPGYEMKNFMIFGFLRTTEKFEKIKESPEFKNLSIIPIPVLLFRYDKLLFGENVMFESLELGEIGELKYLVKQNSEKIDSLETKIGSLETKIGNLDEKIDSVGVTVKEIKETLNNHNGNNAGNNRPHEIPPQLPNFPFFNPNMYNFPLAGFYLFPFPAQNTPACAPSPKEQGNK